MPFDADQFHSLIESLCEYFDLKQVRFYDAVKDRTKDPRGYSKQQRFHERLKKKISSLVIETRRLRYVKSISKETAAEAAKQLGLPRELDDKLYLFLKKLGVVKLSREKGLDILIATHMLHSHKNAECEIILLLSGDSDFVPVVKYMQGEGAKVINLHAFSGSSKELRNACNEHLLVEVELSGNVKIKRYK